MSRTNELRAAYISGAARMLHDGLSQDPSPYFRQVWEEKAAETYPTPTVEVPNEVEGGAGWWWRMVDGRVEYRIFEGDSWRRFEDDRIHLGDIGGYDADDWYAIAEIHENPTITVEIDD